MDVPLPKPAHDSPVSIEQSLARRRSIRHFTADPISLDEISQLLWAMQGITHPSGFRTTPSAGALYPLNLYLVNGLVKELQQGIYLYLPHSHQLRLTTEGDIRNKLASDALGQKAVAKAPILIVMTAVYERTTEKYGQRGIRYVHMDAGHAAQNFCLQATALGLGTVPIGAFQDKAVARSMRLKDNEAPLYILPAGKHPT